MEQGPNSSESWRAGRFPADVERSLEEFAEGEGQADPIQAYGFDDSEVAHGYGALNPHSAEFEAFQKPAIKNVLITVEGDIDEVAERLRRGGVQIDEIDSELGVIFGVINAALEDDYRNLRGVSAIDPSSDVTLWND